MKVKETHREDFTISTDKRKLDIPSIHSFLANETDWAKGIPLDSTVGAALGSSLTLAFLL